MPNLSDDLKRVSKLHEVNILDTAPEQEFESIISLVKSTFQTEMAAISFVDADRQWFKAARGLDVDETPRSVAFCDYTIRDSSVLSVDDATQDERFVQNPLVQGNPGIRCYMGAPITVDGFNLGSLCVIGTQPRSFSEHEEGMLKHFAQIVSTQIKLRYEASKDALTGLLSRGAFFEQVEIAYKVFRERDTASSLIVLDLDHFKSINDRFGHPAGDAVLIKVSEAIFDQIRTDDRAGRIGGEEFGVLLKDIDEEQTVQVAERIRKAVSELKIPDIDSEVTASLGLSNLDPDVLSAKDWYDKADKALYQSKSEGRNRITAAKSLNDA